MFGDDAGELDAYDASGAPIDPAAVAVRWHDSRVAAGAFVRRWPALRPAERTIALWIATELVELLDAGMTEPLGLARRVRDWREYLSGEPLPLADHDLDVELLDELVASLRREGSLR